MKVADYHDLVDINTPREERIKMDIGDIYSNGIKCLKCGWYLRSRNRHDMVTCGCPNSASVDGGSWYVKFGAKSIENVEVRTIMFNDV